MSGSQFLSSLSFRKNLIGFSRAHSLEKLVITHHHRRGSTTGQAFDEFDREFSVFGRLRSMLLRVQAQLRAKVLVQFVRATQRATQCPADPQMTFARRSRLEHRIESDEFVN